MTKSSLLLVLPAQDIDRLGKRRRRKSSMPKLNLALLAAHADEKLFDVRILDETIEEIDFETPADLVGITVLTHISARAYEIARRFRAKGSKVVMGGFHVSFFPDEAEAHADAVVVGEAEGVWPRVLEDFRKGQLQKRYKSSEPHSLVGLPRPRLDLLKRDRYQIGNVIETARGCPHRCAYCAVTLFWGHKFRFRPIPEVIDEIKSMPPGDIVFVDDNIIGAPERAKELFRAMIPLKRRWYSQADLKLARDPELMDLCARSGCQWLFMGIESTNPENLKDVGKSKVNVSTDFKQSLAAIQSHGIKVFGSFIFGLDHDDQDTFKRTVDFCVDNKLTGANFYLLTPLPFTELFDDMDKAGRILHKDWSKYDMNHVVFQPAQMSPEELMRGYLGAYRSMYSVRSILKRTLGFRKDLFHIMALNIGRRLNYSVFEEACSI